MNRRELLKWAAGMNTVSLLADEPAAVPTADEMCRRGVEKASLKMQFRGTSAAACRAWQSQFTGKLLSLLGPFRPPDKWSTVTQRVVELKDHTRHELVLEANGVEPLPMHLLTPAGQTGSPRRAGMLAIHGHGPFGHDAVAGKLGAPGIEENIAKLKYDYGLQLVRRGYVVVVPCLVPFGRRLGDVEGYRDSPCADTFVRMQLVGKLLIAENLRDSLWAFEFLARHSAVDANRLGCAGLSYGGRMAMLVSALEPRIRVAVLGGALNLLQKNATAPFSCGAQVIPGLLEYGDTPEISALIAPRYCLWTAGSHDKHTKPKEGEIALARMRPAFKALGAEDRLQVDHFEGGHEWSGRVAYPLLESVLRT